MPSISTGLTEFFAAEIRNEQSMRRDAGAPGTDAYEDTYDPESEVYVPESSLETALDSWSQAPDTVRTEWTGVPAEGLAAIENELHDLIDDLGDVRLADLT